MKEMDWFEACMQKNTVKFNACFFQVVIALVLIACFVCPKSSIASPCEMPILALFPEIKMSVEEDRVVFYFETLKGDTSGFGAYGFDPQEFYIYHKKAGLKGIGKSEQSFHVESKSPYIKVGDSFTYENTQYKLIQFGIQKIQGNQQTASTIPGIQKIQVESLLGDAPTEYWDNNIFNDPNVTGSEISIALILGNKLFAGFGGGFPEGVGVPGGVAVFDFYTQKWSVDWKAELISLYVTDIVPVSTDTVWFSTRLDMEFNRDPGGIFEYNLKTFAIQELHFSDLEMWALKKWSNYIFMTGPEGITIYDLTKKQSVVYLWNVDVDEQDRVKTELVKCEQQRCLPAAHEKLYWLYIAQLFEIKNKTKFLAWVYGTRYDEVQPGKMSGRNWVPLPFCSDGLGMPNEFLQFIDIKYLMQQSRMRKSPMFWKTLSPLLKASKQEAKYKQLIIDKANDSDGSASKYASECLQELFPKEFHSNVNPLKLLY